MNKQLFIALKKCERYRPEIISAYCTPTEYFLLYKYLELDPAKHDKHNYQDVLDRKNKGDSKPRWHHIHLPREAAEAFPMSQWYR